MNPTPPNSPPPSHAPLPSVPGAHPDDDSIAGEEDPGAGVEDMVTPPAPAPLSPTQQPPA